ncbi:MAG TPA: hypothetical protein VN764_07545, partial [Polyangiaceae bacterium]|nr:hypothetical protein [Polyangiaceae bacterium]
MSCRIRVSRIVVVSSIPALAALVASAGCSPTPGPGYQTGSGGSVSGVGGLAGSGGGGPLGAGGSLSGAGGSASGGSFGSGGAPAGAGGSASGGQSGSGGGDGGSGLDNYNPDFVEFVGEDCTLPESALLSPASHKLPDPFLMSDDQRMTSKSQWACQRAWLKKNIEAHVYGAKPGTPDTVTGTVSATSISVQISHGGKSATYSVSISRPSGATGAVPGMFQAEGSGVPTNFLHAEGVAAMNYNHASAETAFNAIYGGNGISEPIKWAWAVSRAIDVLVAQKAAGANDVIDPTALGTTGCSYAGKSAFVVGAFDERIALGIPMESGTGGLGSYRVVGDMNLGPNGGENPEQVNEACSQGWFTGTVCNGNVDTVPGDAHFVVAMYAPRGFTTLDNNRIG